MTDVAAKKLNIDDILAKFAGPDEPGLAAAIIRDGKLLDAGFRGLANIEWGNPLDANTVLRIGSLTKPFTASAIMLLRQDGALRLNDRLARFLPDYPAADRITLRQLLNHSAGIPNYTSLAGFFETWMRRELTPKELISTFADLLPDFEPGTSVRYSNSGYALLGSVIEAVTGSTWGDLLAERIFQPLGMTRTGYYNNAVLIEGRAAGYAGDVQSGFRNAPFVSMTIPYAAGGLSSTIADLVKWDETLRAGTLVTPDMLREMTEAADHSVTDEPSFGLGWLIGRMRGRCCHYHPGGIDGFSSMMIRFEDDGLSIVLLANRTSLDLQAPMNGLLSTVLPE